MGPHVTERLSTFMDGELDAREHAEVDVHLRACASCARHLEELRAVDSAARALPLRVPDGYFEAFRDNLHERLPGGRPAPRRLAPWALAAAAAVVLALITPRLLRETRPPAVPAEPAPATPGAGTVGRPASTPTAAARKDSTATAADSAAQPEARAAPPAARSAARAPRERRASSAPPYAAAPPPARETDSVQALEDAAAPTEQGPAQAAPMLRSEAEDAASAEEQKARRDKPARGAAANEGRAAAETAADARLDLLLRRTASSAGEARALRDAWRAYAREQGEGPQADEARVRVVELGAEAWRRGREESDRALAERDGREYLERPDARQPSRVREALRSLSP